MELDDINNDRTPLQSRWQNPPQNSSTHRVRSANLSNDELENPINETVPAPHVEPTTEVPLLDNIEFNRRSLRSDLRWWLPEIFGAFLAAASLVCIAIVLRKYQGRNVQDVHLPHLLNLNGLIAILATISRAALTVPVSSVLSQEYWLWLSSASKSPNSQPSLMDLEYSDSASRGAWGSLLFVYNARRRWLAIFAALIIIISLAFGTFTQQILAPHAVLTSRGAPRMGNIQRSETWQNFSGNPNGANFFETALEMKAGVLNGALSANIPPLIESCPTGNCTWPLTPSLAMCGECTKITSYQTYCFNSKCNNGSGSVIECMPQCQYTMPSGSAITLGLFTQDSGGSGTAFQVIPSKGATYNLSDTSRLHIAVFDVFGAPALFKTGYLAAWPNQSTIASECALWFCVQAFNTTVTESSQRQEVIESFSTIDDSQLYEGGDRHSNVTFAELPPSMQSKTLAKYSVNRLASGALTEYLYNTLNGTVTLEIESVGYSNDVMQALWHATVDLNSWIDKVATSMSQVIRTYTPQSDTVYDGTASILIYEYQVRWVWITVPAVLVASSVVLLVVAILRTHRYPVRAWKGSPLALLYMNLDPPIRSHATGRLDARDGLQDSIGKIKVYLERDEVGGRTFRQAPGHGRKSLNERDARRRS